MTSEQYYEYEFLKLKRRHTAPKVEKEEGKRITLTRYLCPDCLYEVNDVWEYCPKCGKAIDWNDSEVFKNV